ncbi:uncharacterized protein LOC142232083 [Haematobia irritans]|uniref:uncharacterized protein LOC142232083 n=1 Tax=Haematobia irritans TaxID=7368 RepID=UPI003F501902
MKPILLLLIIFKLTTSQHLQPDKSCGGAYLQSVIDKCVKQYRINSSEVADGYAIKLYTKDYLKCFRACVFHGCKTFNKDWSFVPNIPQTIAYWTTRRNPSLYPIVEQAGKYCVNTAPLGHTVCDYAENYVQCVKANSPEGISFHGNI